MLFRSGTQGFAAFPVLQYLPFYLAGMVVARSGRGFDPRVLAVAALATAVAAVSAVAAGELPGRFPPTLGWVLLPMAPLYALLLACRAADRWAWAVRPLAAIGARSLVYLLVSNVVIFAVAGTGAGPVLDLGAAAVFAAAVLAATAYLIRLARRAG